ncbi:MAG: 50S ribosomal protein L21 [Alphaproteobacteria bacterium RIFCSPLOWO2_01_FULL_40_26]|nr:MAG: 50S ribosomal protein L21 [Alphaproteobacteria bacterium RIFCSPHIGHO2_02_FULL_40_34]OFW88221.1 MAG: 50S ribosomal protein L21 [Alphaproteobacteria bacterium RIFCSPHIGHO2_01_FULL_40_8]OFW94393.1 MAG: 50S ribosomal protein L21 [Alphaproteobacteria bacterium RIFCSPLOWO2_01_FULL_40_26]OFX09459.1 MAG: 50S ribosomal protein L21 [Alphaproteobacteria bacterium RIFCSPLOWO2_02_FULL_40_19]OFX11627.1 MAG: 50S ribosomal protein L21 [Alphaproteobacteria bacterium RIFCSPLOWO2_12_FULL_40_11]
MFAIVETGGKQYRVSPNEKIIVEKLNGEAGSKIILNRVLLVKSNQDQISFGEPMVKGAEVEAEIVKTFKNDKVLIFKKRRRKSSRRKKGHRQQQTLLKILSIKA